MQKKNVVSECVYELSYVVKACEHMRMDVRLNSELIEEVDCFKYLGSQVCRQKWRMWSGCGTQ